MVRVVLRRPSGQIERVGWSCGIVAVTRKKIHAADFFIDRMRMNTEATA
jgi:hypothetical protein